MNGLWDYFFDRVIIIESTTYQQALNQAIHSEICSKERKEKEGTIRKKRLIFEGGNFEKVTRSVFLQSVQSRTPNRRLQDNKAYSSKSTK